MNLITLQTSKVLYGIYCHHIQKRQNPPPFKGKDINITASFDMSEYTNHSETLKKLPIYSS